MADQRLFVGHSRFRILYPKAAAFRVLTSYGNRRVVDALVSDAKV
jgi:hypothetical protein